MSYLDVPRIHFMGLFYSAPGNLNNAVNNFDLSKELDYKTGKYKYPDGASQIWLERCVVTSVVGLDGESCKDPKLDSLVGARVTSPSPDLPRKTPGGGLYGLAKIVDLDPNMQFRTEVYGLRIYVDIEGGGGFSGEFALPPQLRDLWFGRGDAGIEVLQVAVGTWHQRLTNLSWSAPAAPSPVFEALRARSEHGLDVKIGVDMFQTDRTKQFTEGNRFGYGRLVATIGPASADEPTELVPGRRLYTPTTFDSAAAKSPVTAKAEFTRQAAEVAMSGADMNSEWNRTDCRVCKLKNGRTLLIIDLFNSVALAKDKTGKFATGNAHVLPVGTEFENRFIPMKRLDLHLNDYIQLDTETRKLKDIWWPDNAAVVQFDLEDYEAGNISSTPIVIQMNDQIVLRENPNGVYINIERPSTRLEPESRETFDVFVYKYGQPSAEPPEGLAFKTEIYVDATEFKKEKIDPTEIFKASKTGLELLPTGPGRFRLFVETGPAVPLTKERKPLDNCLCFLTATGDKYLVGEAMTLKPRTGPPTPPFLSFLFWQNHQVVEQPTWDRNIKPLMDMYARLFPGMASILAINDFKTVKAHAPAFRTRFLLSRNDPGFMPVSRDMSPATVRMMVRFLDTLIKEQHS